MSATYCEYSQSQPIHRLYLDTEYGFPIREDSALLERLALEIGQAGLSWETILKKKEGYKRAFEGFVLDCVAAYGEAKEQRLLADGVLSAITSRYTPSLKMPAASRCSGTATGHLRAG